MLGSVIPNTVFSQFSMTKASSRMCVAPMHIDAPPQNALFWRDKLLKYMGGMLATGDYTLLQRSRHTDFFSTWITSFLGQKPLSVDGQSMPAAESYMCDDHTPIEFSLSWKPNREKPLVRYSIEPLPPDGQTDPSVVIAYGLHVIQCLQHAFQSRMAGADYITLYPHPFMRICKALGLGPGGLMDAANVSNVFVGFDLLPDYVQVKAYLVLRPSLSLPEKLALISEAMSTSQREAPWSVLANYLQSKPAEWHSAHEPDPLIMGVDCIRCDDARVKVYFRYQFTHMDSLLDQLSLGGKILLSPSYITSLRQIWCRLTEFNSNPFIRSSHTSGMLAYYEFRATSPVPMVKVYLPARLMGKNDLTSANAAAAWLGNHLSLSGQSGSFLTAMEKIWDDRDLSESSGTFTYVGLTAAADAEPYLSVYFNPCIFLSQAGVESNKKLGASVLPPRNPLASLLKAADFALCEIPANCWRVAHTWFEAFSRQLCDPSSNFESIFVPNGFWRDLVAFSPDIQTLHPRSSIRAFLNDRSPYMHPHNLKMSLDIKGRVLIDSFIVIQGTFTLETCAGHCSGVFSLVPTVSGGWKALTIVICLETLCGSTDKFPEEMPMPRSITPCTEPTCSITEYPTVVVIGAGQAGLAIAARLANLGITSLVIERRGRVGDGWRHRYDSLNINTPKDFSHMPFIPFPSEWPMFPASSAVADHLEAYPSVLGLRVITSTTVTHTFYDISSEVWTLRISSRNGPRATIRTRHIILATGVGSLAGSEPKLPSIPREHEFQGRIMHSTEFVNGKDWYGKKAIVIGAGCSGHDIAQELHRRGAESVTMIQRSSVAVVSREMLIALFPDLYTGDNRPPTAIADRLFLAFPTTVTRSLQHEIMKKKAPIDRHLLKGLRSKGFLLPDEDDNFFERLTIQRGRYYIDQGCSSLIINGKISLKAGIPMTAYTPSGIVFEDGTEVQADLVVYATGFRDKSPIESSSKLLNYNLVGKIKSLGNWDSQYEETGLWRPTGHRGLWFAGGDLFNCRVYSRLLAMQIKAEEDGIFGPSQPHI